MSVVVAFFLGLAVLVGWPGRPRSASLTAHVGRLAPTPAGRFFDGGAELSPTARPRVPWQDAKARGAQSALPAYLELLTGMLPGRRESRRRSQRAAEILNIVEATGPALRAGLTPAAALLLVANEPDATGGRSGLAQRLEAAASSGQPLGPVWLDLGREESSGELGLVGRAWTLSETLGAPLADAVETAAALLRGRASQRRRLASATAGAKATMDLLTVLPLAGPLLGIAVGIDPRELYGASALAEASCVAGVLLALLGRLWVRRMLDGVTRGPVLE